MMSHTERPEDPTGLPSEDEPEPTPLGAPEGDDEPESDADAMPGIVTDGDPPDAG